MPNKGGPAVELAVAKTLTANLNAQLDAVWAGWAAYDAINVLTPGGVPKNYPQFIYAGYVTEIPEFPAIIVTCPTGHVAEDMAPSWQWMRHHVEITVVVESDTVPSVEAMLKRYLVAIWEVLVMAKQLDGSLAGLAGLGLTDYGKSAVYKSSNQPGMIMQTGGWNAIVEMDEAT